MEMNLATRQPSGCDLNMCLLRGGPLPHEHTLVCPDSKWGSRRDGIRLLGWTLGAVPLGQGRDTKRCRLGRI